MSVSRDWYQTDDKVVITVKLKDAVDKKYKCDINDNYINLTADNYELHLELLRPIVPEKSSHKATKYNVEITLIKKEFGRWEMLEKKIEEEKKPVAVKSKKPEDWEKIAKEVEKDKEEV